ncbi:MAG TPA: amidohydrolase family protein [Vicinamibacterales bacterium]|nr:amidohydrolase family protein [Vicinamibacterales bacterium]
MTTFMPAADCHVHVFGPRDRYPQRPDRAYTAGVASLETLRSNAEPLGITRFVIVQASVHGTDNSCLLDTLDALDGNGRGVVVVDPKTIAPATLDDWSTRGARGLRINLYSDYKSEGRGGDRGPEKAALHNLRDRFTALVDIAPPGWHIEVIAPMPMLGEHAQMLADSRVPVVIDHYGLPDVRREVRLKADSTCEPVLELLRHSHVWMKLSGPYRALEKCGGHPDETQPPVDWLRAFVAAAPDRVVWGSDWPHTPAHEESRHGDAPDPFRPIDYGKMFADFLMAVSPPALEAILVANPARLYGFA